MPPGQRRYEVQLSSKSGAIDVFLIQDPGNTGTSSASYNNSSNSNSSDSNNAKNTHFHASEMLKPFDIPMDAFAFELKADEGASDLYGGVGNGISDVYSVFNDRRV